MEGYWTTSLSPSSSSLFSKVSSTKKKNVEEGVAIFVLRLWKVSKDFKYPITSDLLCVCLDILRTVILILIFHILFLSLIISCEWCVIWCLYFIEWVYFLHHLGLRDSFDIFIYPCVNRQIFVLVFNFAYPRVYLLFEWTTLNVSSGMPCFHFHQVCQHETIKDVRGCTRVLEIYTHWINLYSLHWKRTLQEYYEREYHEIIFSGLQHHNELLWNSNFRSLMLDVGLTFIVFSRIWLRWNWTHDCVILLF